MKKYPIPAYPPSISLTFAKLCQGADPEGESQLESKIGFFRSKISAWERAKPPQPPHVIKVATALLESALFMARSASKYTKEKQVLIAAAINYLNMESDGINDKTPIVGLQDDAKIFNHVLEELEVTDRFIV